MTVNWFDRSMNSFELDVEQLRWLLV